MYSKKLITRLFVLISQFNYVIPSAISFCDGSEGKIEKSREQCSSGYNFGEKRPDCVCIKGIYRLWTDSCETADGFADEVCTKLHDSSTKSNIVGLKLTKDPIDWSKTGVVCEKKSFGSETWDLITENSRGASTKNNNIYVLNGKAFSVSKGGKSSICVKPAILPEKSKICKYFKKDNADLWKQYEIEIEVKQDCTGVPLKSSSCFGVLQKHDSECELNCQPKGRSLTSSKNKKQTPSINTTNTNTKSVKGVNSLKGVKGNGKVLSGDPKLQENMTNPADYRKHDNKFLNRKMLIYNVISQIEESPKKKRPYTIPYGDPKKTFELFDKMKNIAKKFCPDEYVNSEWIELAINLFYILHKGNVFRYEEPLSDEQYEWIKSILNTCENSITSIDLTVKKDNGTSSSGSCGINSGGKASGYCNGTSAAGCNFRPVTVTPEHANSSYHYVPDVAWDIIDLVQVACFDSFNASYRMFHVLEQASEKLFSLQVKNLWYYPGWSQKTKTKLLGAAADLQMYNLEVCVESAYDRNGKIPRLVRPTAPKYLRRKKRSTNEELTSVGINTQVYCGRTKKDFIYPQNCGAP